MYSKIIPLDRSPPHHVLPSGLKLADSTIAGYKKIIRNHLRPQFGHYPLDKLTPARIARHYRDLEQHGRKDEQDKGGPLCWVIANTGIRRSEALALRWSDLNPTMGRTGALAPYLAP
ncbi:hypothetical protein [Timonella sp. A28]|uniref:hypothetical protein n=1 Tax=Timonella sp. A28 TaxID=3442640 RepID=UPI003EBAABEE